MASLTLKSIFQAIDRMSGPVQTMTGNVNRNTASMQKGFLSLGRGAMRVGSFLKGAAITLAAGAAAKAVSDFAERGDDIARNAGILGLSAKAYQELSYAANMADVEQEAFASATKKLSKNLGDLRIKEGTLYTTLAKTNPKLAIQLRDAKSTDDAFNLIAAAIAKETNAQKRAVLAQAAFGKTGQELIPMMEDLARLRDEAQKSGTIISEKDIATASRLDDALKRLKAQGMSIANQGLGLIAEQLTPELEKLSVWFAENKDVVSANIKTVFDTIKAGAKGLDSVISTIRGLSDVISGTGDTIEGFITGNKALTKSGTSRLENLPDVSEGFLDTIGLGGFMDSILPGLGRFNNNVMRFLGVKDPTQYMDPSGKHRLKAGSEIPLPASATAALAQSVSSESISRSVVDINIPTMPPGGSVRQRGVAPGVTLNTGVQMQPSYASGGAH